MREPSSVNRALIAVVAVVALVMLGIGVRLAVLNGAPAEEGPSPSTVTVAPVDAFTGLELHEGERPSYVAIVVENSPSARPQRGLSRASLVYEVPAEGGITRFIACYSAPQEGPVGPVRSIRPYMVTIARSHGAPLVHCGGSSDALKLARQLSYPTVDELRSGSGSGFWRDAARHMPHNLYTGADQLTRRLADDGIATDGGTTGFVYASSKTGLKKLPGSVACTAIGAKAGAGYSVDWGFDNSLGRFIRSVNNRVDCDADGGAQIAVDNVVFMFVPCRIVDEEGRLELAIEGSGRALVASGGVAVEGRWERHGSGPFRLLDLGMNDVKLASGRTWVHVVDTSTRVSVTGR